MAKKRNTRRKEIVSELILNKYVNTPVVVEELRWEAFVLEVREKGRGFFEMSRSYRTSFMRTLKSGVDGVFVKRMDRPDLLPVGITAKAALFRLSDRRQVTRFLSGKEPCVHLWLHPSSIRYFLAAEFYTSPPENPEHTSNPFIPGHNPGMAVVRLPLSTHVILASSKPIVDADTLRLADSVKWRLYRTTSARLTPMSPRESLRVGRKKKRGN